MRHLTEPPALAACVVVKQALQPACRAKRGRFACAVGAAAGTWPSFACLAATLLLVTCASAEILDRVAVSVGNSVITRDEVRREVRLTAFLNGEPSGARAPEMRKAAERLVEQLLVRRELELAHYPTPGTVEIEPLMKGLDLTKLAAHGLTTEDLRAHFAWQVQLLRFVDFRFRPGVQVSNAEIQEYFERRVLPSKPGADLEGSRSAIETALTEEQVDKQLDAWLREARTHSRIEFRDEAFE